MSSTARVPLMDMRLGWEWPDQQIRQAQDEYIRSSNRFDLFLDTHQDNHYPMPNPTNTDQQYFNAQRHPAPQVQSRCTIPSSKQTKPYAQPNNAQQHVAPPITLLVDNPRGQSTTAQQHQNTTTIPTTKSNHVILSDSTMPRFRLPQLCNNTVNIRIKSNSGFGVRDYTNKSPVVS
ncbi:unnamed protein product [Didymodactylos carnosus]|uniref:Uncharacterized protein n=1 Tax=Didymodactylos carnosus TaxID=1234261 RepID=A0A815VSH3_9BILA|nr:unnamed protein product [Didymodactylos carnosus]CAF1538932.1 unnamed protein product [Didymodactylos carnosus]CAF3766661.1 unnamed protein product [Didymodactylos carnosus]CAF4399077.1 unnamed protein product [Didymodactylos carnosus]